MRRLALLLIAALPAFSSTITNATLTGFETTTVSGSAIAFYFGNTSLDPNSIFASAHATGLTLGPVRSGFIEITGSGFGEFGGGNGSIGGYSFGCTAACSPSNYLNGTPLPFTLGVPFQIDVSAFASSLGTGSGNISFQFSLFESASFPGFAAFPGEKVVIYDPPEAPEPATLMSVGLGLFSLATVYRRRRTEPSTR